MVRTDLKEKATKNRKKIEETLATAKKGLSLSELSERAEIPVSTAKRHLDQLSSKGRVHVEKHKGFNVYRGNGKRSSQDKLHLSENHILFIDAMVNPWGEPFIRVKETKKRPNSNDWEDVGAIMVDENSVGEFIEKVNSISENLGGYGE